MLIKKDGYKNNWLLTQFRRLSLMLDVEGITLAIFIFYEDGFTYAEILEFLRVHHGLVVRLYRAFFAISDLTKTCAIWQKKQLIATFYLQSWAKIFTEIWEITISWTGIESLDIFFCVVWPLLPIFCFWKERKAIVSTQFWNFRTIVATLFWDYFVFYLWPVRSLLKRCNIPKFYDHDSVKILEDAPRKIKEAMAKDIPWLTLVTQTSVILG